MAADNITWRKTPIDLLVDENFSYISSQMKPGEETAPYMFYLTCLRKADEDGAFDLEDGLMFSRLMRVGDKTTVFKIANLMMQRQIITRVGTSSKCMLVEWEYVRDKQNRTMDQRRAIVARKIEQEKKLQMQEFDPDKTELSFDDDAPVFSCPENDKIQNNVANEVFDDKNQKNVVKKNAPREIERENTDIEDTRDIKKDTHTQENTREIETGRDREDAPPDFLNESGSTSQDEIQTKSETETEISQEELTLEDIPNSIAKSSNERDMASACTDVFNVFFAKVCKGYNAFHYRYEIDDLVHRVINMQDKNNPADVIAGLITKCFEKQGNEKYYKGLPLQPDYLLKPGIWSHVVRTVTEILNTSDNKKLVEEQRREALSWDGSAASEEIDGKVYVGFDAQYVKYGIDPSDPNASHLLMQAMSAEKKVKEPP